MNDNKTEKGKLKNYNLWLYNEIKDVANLPEPDSQTKKFISRLHNHFSTKYQSDSAKNEQKMVALTKLKPPSKENSLKFWETIEEGVYCRISSYLVHKDIVSLFGTNKLLKFRFDSQRIWRTLFLQDLDLIQHRLTSGFLDTDDDSTISIRELYKYMTLTFRTGVMYHSGLLIPDSSPETLNLVKNLVDFVTTTTLSNKLNSFLPSWIGENLTRDIKLSWLKEENEVIIWLAGFETAEVPTEPEKKTAEVNRANSFVLRQYKLPDEQKIKRTFFLNKKYLIVEYEEKLDEEVKQNDLDSEEDENPSGQNLNKNRVKGFVIVDFEYEMTCILTHNQRIKPFEVKLFRCEQDLLKSKPSKDILGISLNLDQEIGNNSCFIEIESLVDGNIIFFNKNITQPFFVICDPKTQKLASQFSIALDAPLSDLLTPKIFPKSNNEVKLYLIDTKSTFYFVSYLIDNKELLLKKIVTNESNENQVVEEEEEMELPPRFRNVCQRYHHGLYDTTVDGKKFQTEFLIMHKSLTLYFIDLNDLRTQKFCFNDAVEGCNFTNWSIYENILFIHAPPKRLRYQITFPEFAVHRLSDLSVKELGQIAEWAYHNPCFSVIVTVYPLFTSNAGKLRLIIKSTQDMMLSLERAENSPMTVFDVEEMLDDICFKNTQKSLRESIAIKFEKEKLLIKTHKYNFFFDFEMHMVKAEKPWVRWAGSQTTKIRSLYSQREAKELKFYLYEENKKKIALKEAERKLKDGDGDEDEDEDEDKLPKSKRGMIPENPNRTSWSNEKKKAQWKSKEISEAQKDERETNKAIRAKGNKFYKNVRDNERQSKN